MTHRIKNGLPRDTVTQNASATQRTGRWRSVRQSSLLTSDLSARLNRAPRRWRSQPTSTRLKTTTAIIEILVGGLFGSVWLFIVVMWATGTEWNVLTTWARDWNGWSTALTAIGALVVYEVGWLVNGLTRSLTRHFAKREIIRVFANISDEQGMPPVPEQPGVVKAHEEAHAELNREDKIYQRVRAAVYQRGSPHIVDDLALEQSVIRLARGGALNFFITAVFLLLLTKPNRSIVLISVLLVILALWSGLQWWYRNQRYYDRILSAYRELPPPNRSILPQDQTPGRGEVIGREPVPNSAQTHSRLSFIGWTISISRH
jgi:hypothetical protein